MALSIGAVVSDAVQWLSTEIRKTLDEEVLGESPALSCPRSPDSPTRVAFGEEDRFSSPRQRVVTRAASVSLDCLVCWQDALETAPCCSAPFLDASSTPSTCGDSPCEAASLRDRHRATQTRSDSSSFRAERNACSLHAHAERRNSPSFAWEDHAEKHARETNPFPVDEGLNRRLFLHYGDPCTLKVDAIVCFINEAFKPIDKLGTRLAIIGGDELADEVRHLERCKAGEARICRSFNLPSSHVIYTVGPRFNSKYITATHNALNGCLRESLLLLDENGLTTVAVPLYSVSAAHSRRSSSLASAALPPHSLRRMQRREEPGSPGETRAAREGREAHADVCRLAGESGDEADAYVHTSLRTLRRWMERLREKLDAVVLIVDDVQEMRACEAFVKLYFPRNEAEEAEALYGLPEELGDAFGQIEVVERRMRVGREGSAASHVQSGEITAQFGSLFMRACESDSEDGGLSPREENRILNSADVSFTDAKACTETERRINALNATQDPAGVDSEALYHRYLRQASAIADCVAFQQLDAIGFLSPRGTDRAGRPLVVFFAALFPSTPVDAHLVLLYIIKTLDPYIRDKYTLLYVNTEVHHSHMPSMALWKEFFHLFSQYENTLDQLLVLHPGFLFKAAFACMWPYLPTNLWRGTFYLDSIKDLSTHVDERQLRLPNYVVEYDQLPRKRILGLRL
ncbi:hypothetical protein NCLIV_058280 [Neospora caninum Liverpool]|uniref:Protein GDAP2 homolog n=1 Tax=Neospora caninum (strain Liverpool) TaxID=572307 RepID=F0VNV9_NEOCL|nr:hypothetical protein NCLIV_058280 [Neospora caninum Liverpool]CBZ55405.1 hypothetical protein NCLIV_058280 [Neospora caninum Liverpool]CEL70141.1 TPA: Protein GDAP2 homolog [Neospora caninum Liverpool]|eukprot:XP_003885433.1 hypothetical protein NCLIV_058280 [Neospora caninum Liverpool]